ncbi:hypothetical protein [Peredibacter starrii]|uniref:Uncharacterized protein n=1 Tax=Peredibacter starrii TaxID=28202 RepID=A0AAX4HQ70_9BACT|nr:hypothetical protein [Peredibacter starrii]WPU65094.1 hypothetical protein SOO65_20565 [Peredibacter starrii]
MNHFVKSIGLSVVLSASAFAAGKKEDYKNYYVPSFKEASFDDAEFIKEKKEWTKANRKIASQSSFSNSDMSADLQKLREEWLQVKTGDQMEALLKASQGKYGSYSEDTRYFLAQMQLALPLRGIVWRLRPLFEEGKGFLGNKSTHVTAVQAVRTMVSGLKTFLPTKQTDASIQFFTEPSVEMTKSQQFHSISQVQNFLMTTIIPAITEASNRITALSKDGAHKAFIWDNKMAFGTGTFDDEIHRFVGHGPAEINFTIASLARAQHNILVYCAYNQDQAITLAGEMGSHFGIDSSIFASKKDDLGMTDKERSTLVRRAVSKRFLELRNYEGSQYGSQLMKQAYIALKNSVVYFDRSNSYLQGRESSPAMSLNPIMFQEDGPMNLDKGIKNMKAVVSGIAEVRDPVSGETVTINVPAFYNNPPTSLAVLMATDFEGGEVQKTIKNKKGENLVVRNYTRGRSIAWDNNAWKQYVPSAEGQKPGYMADAQRIIQYSPGTSAVFGLPDMFVH